MPGQRMMACSSLSPVDDEWTMGGPFFPDQSTTLDNRLTVNSVEMRVHARLACFAGLFGGC